METSHSVQQHLAVSPDAYDAEIHRFVPSYEEMLDEALEVLVRLGPRDAPLRVVDLGAGTGALSSRIATRLPHATITLLDADARMLEQAEARLAQHRARIQLLHGTFSSPLPECDVMVASLSLHHVHDPAAKIAVYGNIRRSLAPGGWLISADAAVARSPALADISRARWAGHLVASGDTEQRAYERFAEWAKEDRYFSIEQEFEMVRAAGFSAVDVVWRRGPMSLLVAAR